MKRTALALTFIVALLILALARALVFEVAEANWYGMMKAIDNVVITVQSPQNITYTERTVLLDVTIETFNNESWYKTRYILNNEKPVDVKTPIVSERQITNLLTYQLANGTWYNVTVSYPRYTAQGSVLLSNLANGTYCLTVQRYYYYDAAYANPERVRIFNATTVSFTINATAPSEHDLETVPLPNSLTLSADVAVVASITLVAVIGIGLLVYFKKHLKFERKR